MQNSLVRQTSMMANTSFSDSLKIADPTVKPTPEIIKALPKMICPAATAARIKTALYGKGFRF